MENKRIYNVENHYVVEIDQVNADNGYGSITTTFTWDVYIASKGEEYLGMAKENNQGLIYPWTVLTKDNLLEEMIGNVEISMMSIK